MRLQALDMRHSRTGGPHDGIGRAVAPDPGIVRAGLRRQFRHPHGVALAQERLPQGAERGQAEGRAAPARDSDRKSTRLNSSHLVISYAVFCLKKKNMTTNEISICSLLASRGLEIHFLLLLIPRPLVLLTTYVSPTHVSLECTCAVCKSVTSDY